MQQKINNHQNQESIDKKCFFLVQSLSHLPRWVHLVQKSRAKNSHAWSPLRVVQNQGDGDHNCSWGQLYAVGDNNNTQLGTIIRSWGQ
jgi:hypothetical protein